MRGKSFYCPANNIWGTIRKAIKEYPGTKFSLSEVHSYLIAIRGNNEITLAQVQNFGRKVITSMRYRKMLIDTGARRKNKEIVWAKGDMSCVE